MHTNRPALCAAQWLIPDTESIDALMDVILSEQAWWIALRSGQHAHRGIVWADGGRRPGPRRRTQGLFPIRIPAAPEDSGM